MDVKRRERNENSIMGSVRKGWLKMTNRYYQKTEMYDMVWDGMDLSLCHVAIAPFGGLIAVAPDEKKRPKEYSQGQGITFKNKVRIYTSAGRKICEFTWRYKGLVGIGWTDTEHLVVVIAEGKEQVFLYSMHGECVESFGLRECKTVAECRIWGSGLVCRAAGMKCEFFAVQNFQKPRVTRLRGPGVAFKPTAMVAIPSDISPSGNLQVLLASPRGPVQVISHEEPSEVMATARDDRPFNGPFVRMALSPSGRYLATVNRKGTLTVLESDFSNTISEFVTREKNPPIAIAWCGEDSVILYWDKILIMVGPFGAYMAFKYPRAASGSIQLHTEVDGCRVVTNTKCEFLHRVQGQSESIFKQGSKEAPAMVLEAAQAFEKSDIAADLCIRQMKSSGKDGLLRLRDAVVVCLEAALQSFEPNVQAALLRAAAYGKLFCEDDTGEIREEFEQKCKLLRVLNNVRDARVGMPLTYAQYESLGIDVLVDRLVNRHEHLLALRICDHMKMKSNKQSVLEHWACARIRASDTEDHKSLGETIIKKLSICPGISFGKIANTAFVSGLKELAAMVLEQEPRASDQVSLLISMEQENRALVKAIESRDANLIYTVLLHVMKTHLGGDEGSEDADDIQLRTEFYKLLTKHPLVLRLLLAYFENHGLDSKTAVGQKALDMLKRVYYHLQLETEAAKIKVVESLMKNDWDQRIKMLEIAQDLYKVDPFAVNATREQVRLLQIQRKCEVDFKKPFVDLSLNATLEKLIRLGHTDRASRLKREFAVPDKRYWHIQVKTLGRERDWNALTQLAATKRYPPIGFEPFIEVCVEQKATQEAVAYISRLANANDKMEWFCSIHCYGEAADVAFDDKNLEALQYISTRAKSKPLVKVRIDEMINKLS